MQLPFFKLMKESIKAVPAVKYAFGIAGILSVIALVKSIGIDYRISVIGTILMFILMVVLVIFAKLTKTASKHFVYPVLCMLWSFLTLTIATATLIFTSVFFQKPIDLKQWISGKETPYIKQITPNDEEQASDGLQHPWVFRGRTIDESTNEALAGATIQIGDMLFNSDVRGNFEIELNRTDAPRAITIKISKNGYQSQALTLTPPRNDLRILLKKTL